MQSSSSRRTVILATASAVSLTVPRLATGASKITIEGKVTSSSGQPVAGVTVAVDRPGVSSVPTDASGTYRLEISAGPPIGQLSYSHSRFDYAVVENLSGVLNQSISKVMYSPGEKRPAVALVDTLGAYEQLLVALLQSGPAERQQTAAAYRKANWLAFVRELPADGGEATEWLRFRKMSLESALSKAMGSVPR